MNVQRREVLKGAGAASVVGVALAAGLLKPTAAHAWNAAGFESKNVADALKAINATGAADSAQITVKAPDIAENGAVVPVEISSALPNT
ncbi:MAG: thiosulfate oxidation carrier protein SoxY, partial [Thiobacillaceae bacterium]|nr:thiosulfate oxidation carrier protein SoxY [Thiobacillaceae bacterium]